MQSERNKNRQNGPYETFPKPPDFAQPRRSLGTRTSAVARAGRGRHADERGRPVELADCRHRPDYRTGDVLIVVSLTVARSASEGSGRSRQNSLASASG